MLKNNILHKIPYIAPNKEDWSAAYGMLCGHCDNQLKCDIVEQMIEAGNNIDDFPTNGFVCDEGGGVTCLSYKPRARPPFPEQELNKLLSLPEEKLPPQCKGCAATKGSKASLCHHTNKDFQGAVRNETKFLCHEGDLPICGGWIRAIRAKQPKSKPEE